MWKKIKRKIRRKGKELSRKNEKFDKIYSIVIRAKRALTYRRFSRLPIDQNAIVFDSFMGRRCGDSPKAIYDYMINNSKYDGYSYIWCLRSTAKKEFYYLNDNPRTTVVSWGTKDYYKAYATSKYWISNTRIPGIIKKRDGQVYLQCWHGTPLKKLFCDIKTDDIKRMKMDKRVISEDSGKYTYMISPSRFYSDIVKSAFNLTEQGKENVIIETGYPRNDSITIRSHEKASIKSKLGINKKDKVILYAPTYREDQKRKTHGYIHNEEIDFGKFLKNIPDDYIILFRAHYYVTGDFDFERYGGKIKDVSMYADINDLYIVADLLITDYSSVFFDYSILKKPIIFFMTDYNHYKNDLRGLYLNLEELPGPITVNQKELEAKINTLGEWTSDKEYRLKYEKFNNTFTYLDDGKATERVVNIVFPNSI